MTHSTTFFPKILILIKPFSCRQKKIQDVCRKPVKIMLKNTELFAILILCSLVKSSQCHSRMHTEALTLVYPGTDVKRFPVPSEFVDWKVPFPEYKPVDYTSEHILKRPPYADPEIMYYM